MDGLLTAEEFPAEFDENLDTMTSCTRRIVGSPPNRPPCAEWPRWWRGELNLWRCLARWSNEMCRCVLRTAAGLWRYETSGEITLLAVDYRSHALAKWPVGTRIPIDGNTLAAMVQRTGGPARMDSYENSAGQLAARLRDAGVRAAAGVPVIVDGRVWGLAVVGSVEPGPMPADTEARISGFAELIAHWHWWPVIATSRSGSSWVRVHTVRI